MNEDLPSKTPGAKFKFLRKVKKKGGEKVISLKKKKSGMDSTIKSIAGEEDKLRIPKATDRSAFSALVSDAMQSNRR